MEKYDISLKLPVLCLDVSGEYSRFKRPTGLENLILTAIGTDSLNKETWETFFNRLSIPKRMLPVFKGVVKELYDNDVLADYDFDLDDTISDIRFTDTGQDLFEQGRIKQDPNRFGTTIYYTPYSKFNDPSYYFNLKTTDQKDFEQSKFSEISFSKDAIMKFLMTNKKEVGAGTEDEILDIFINEDFDLLCSKKKITLSFDESTGDFIFDTEVNKNFIKGYFSAEDLLSAYPENLFNEESIRPITISDIPAEWDSYRYHLPKDFKFSGKLKVVNEKKCNINGCFSSDSLEYHFVDILDSKTGRGYVCIRKNIAVMGLDGTTEQIIMISHPLKQDEIKLIVKNVCSKNDMADPDSIATILPFIDILDKNEQYSLISNHISNTNDIDRTMSVFSKISEMPIFDVFSSVIEDHICDKRIELTKAIELLKKNNLKIRCDRVCSTFSKKNVNEDTKLADSLFPITSDRTGITSSLEIREHLAEIILNNKPGLFNSKELMNLNNAAKTFDRLKSYFGIITATEYDLSKFDESNRDAAKQSYDMTSKGLSSIDMLISDTEGYRKITGIMNVAQNLVEVYCKDVPLNRLNGYQFGAGIRRKMDLLFKKISNGNDLQNMIDNAFKQKIITKEQCDLFHKIRDYGNKCVHTSEVPPISSEEKQKWVKAIEAFEKEINKGGKKK